MQDSNVQKGTLGDPGEIWNHLLGDERHPPTSFLTAEKWTLNIYKFDQKFHINNPGSGGGGGDFWKIPGEICNHLQAGKLNIQAILLEVTIIYKTTSDSKKQSRNASKLYNTRNPDIFRPKIILEIWNEITTVFFDTLCCGHYLWRDRCPQGWRWRTWVCCEM